ncbi:hypothetical protein P8452_47622 [Trifolium repens]|nr:hypothetical protein P8452_47622 [Trifolium repens]
MKKMHARRRRTTPHFLYLFVFLIIFLPQAISREYNKTEEKKKTKLAANESEVLKRNQVTQQMHVSFLI